MHRINSKQVKICYASSQSSNSNTASSSESIEETRQSDSESERETLQVVKSSKGKDRLQIGLRELGLQMPSRICCLGASQGGKTTLIRHLIQYFKRTHKVSSVWWMGSNAHKEKYIPRRFRSESILKARVDMIRKAHTEFPGYHSLLILDDVLTEMFHRDPWWESLLGSSRHENLTIIIGIQYLKKLSPLIRDNITHYMITSINQAGVESLRELSRSRDINSFRDSLYSAQKGKPVCLCTIPGTRELTPFTIGPLEACDVK